MHHIPHLFFKYKLSCAFEANVKPGSKIRISFTSMFECEIALDLSKEVQAEEIKIKEEQDKIDKERAERELETNGVSPDM